MTTIYLIRHCETKGNQQRLFQGRIDMDISEAGEQQLAQLAERFRNITIDKLYSSPLLRAQRTAMAVAKFQPMDIELDERLIEINGGCWEGRSWNDMPIFDPEQSRRWLEEPWNFGTEDGEPMREVYDRMKNAVLDIAAKNDGKRVAIVSHGCAIRNAMCFAKGWPIEQLHQVPWCDNTGICVLNVEDGRVEVITENDHSHLTKQASPAEQNSWWRG